MVAATGPPCWEAAGHLPMPQPTRRCARTRQCGRAVGMAAMDGPSRLSPRGGHSRGTSSWPYMAGGWQPTRGAPVRQLLAPGSAARGRSVTPGDVAMSRAAVDTGPSEAAEKEREEPIAGTRGMYDRRSRRGRDGGSQASGPAQAVLPKTGKGSQRRGDGGRGHERGRGNGGRSAARAVLATSARRPPRHAGLMWPPDHQ